MTEKENEMTGQVVKGKKKREKKPKKKFFERRFSWYLVVILLGVLIVVIGALLGGSKAIKDRVSLAETQAAPKIHAQLDSAKLDIEEGRYSVAQTRLDWILDEMSEFLTDEELVEVGELYSQTLLMINSSSTATPAVTPTPTEPEITPTPDYRGEEDLFNTAKQYLNAEAWNDAINTLEALREKNLEYRAVEVDGMLYIALRNRGVQKLLVDGSLEPGLYDLTLAERFAPLDNQAEGYRTYARMYITGASYWEVDWLQVIYYFEQVKNALPGLRDGTNLTAAQRYQKALIGYGEQLAAAEQFCEAQAYFEQALAINSDPAVQPTAQWVYDKCFEEQQAPTQQPQSTEPPASTPTPTPTVGETTVVPTEEVPTEAPTEEPTPDGGGGE
jgi:tetratricopeptide (TPR) repeat protein